jgi:hypothetical protein
VCYEANRLVEGTSIILNLSFLYGVGCYEGIICKIVMWINHVVLAGFQQLNGEFVQLILKKDWHCKNSDISAWKL